MTDDPILAALARLEAGQNDLSLAIGGLRTDLAEVRADLAVVLTEQDSLRAEMARFRVSLTNELGSTRYAIMAQIASLQRDVASVRDDIGVNMGSVDARDMFRIQSEQLSDMWRQLKELQEEVRVMKGGTP